MNKRPVCILAGVITIILAMGSCAPINRHSIEKKYYDLITPQPDEQDRNLSRGAPILIKEFKIAPQFDSHSFIYRINDKEYTNDYYHEFITYPAKLITDKFIHLIYATSYFSSVRTSRQLDIEYRLSGEITQLFGDFQIPDRPKAVLALQLILEKRDAHTFSIIHSHTYAADIDIPKAHQEDLIAGWSRGFITIFEQFMADVTTKL